MTDYGELCLMLRAAAEGVEYLISDLANAAALLWENLDDLNWAGFYLMRDGKLILGPFQGKTACTVIEPGRGVCGTAVVTNKTQLVPDVHAFSGHIACDGASNSEIVVPIRVGGRVAAVLDLDSPSFARFNETDRAGLEDFAAVIEEIFEKTKP